MIWIIPIVIVASLLSGGHSLATGLMIVFRGRYPRWWFDFARELTRFGARVAVYLALTPTHSCSSPISTHPPGSGDPYRDRNDGREFGIEQRDDGYVQQKRLNQGACVALGAAIGAAVGSAIGSVGVGIAVGVAIGAAIAAKLPGSGNDN